MEPVLHRGRLKPMGALYSLPIYETQHRVGPVSSFGVSIPTYKFSQDRDKVAEICERIAKPGIDSNQEKIKGFTAKWQQEIIKN